VQLDHVLVFLAAVGVKLFQRELLETSDGRGGVRVDADRIPRLQDLRSQTQRLGNVPSELERLAPHAERGDEGFGTRQTPPSVETARGTGESVAKKRATCWSNRYVDPVTRVEPSAESAPITTSSPPCPRIDTCDFDSCSGKAA